MDAVEDQVATFLGSKEIDWEELRPVLCFVVLWNRLEVWFQRNLHYKDLLKTIEKVAGESSFTLSAYERQIEFIRDRYKSIGVNGLLFKKGEDLGRDAMNRLIQCTSTSTSDSLLGLMMLPYRVRNNLFHGNKDTMALYRDFSLFATVNQILLRFTNDAFPPSAVRI